MRATLHILAIFILSALASAPLSARQSDGYAPREQHPWGQFKIGSWKRVRTVTETLNEQGAVVGKSETETTTKLVDVDRDGYTLRIDVAVQVAGKRFTAQPQVIRQGFHGEGEGQSVSIKQVGAAGLTINGHKIPCEVREVTVDGDAGKRITTVHYSERFAPYVLRRETTSLDSAGKPTDLQSQVDVVAIDMPCLVREEFRPTSHLRIMHQRAKAATLTIEIHCADVPGGVVSHTSKETDEAGRVVRRSTLELVDYGVGTGEDSDAQMVRKAFHRVRNRRMR